VSGRLTIKVGFSTADCRPCPSWSRCTRTASRRLGLLPRPEHEAIAAARARLETKAGRRLYGQRQGIEGTISQGVRALSAPGTLLWAGQGGSAKCDYRRSHQPRPARSVVRPTLTRPHPHFALRRYRHLTAAFANSIPPFMLHLSPGCFDFQYTDDQPASGTCTGRLDRRPFQQSCTVSEVSGARREFLSKNLDRRRRASLCHGSWRAPAVP
jgi:hypothetical protein